MCHNVLHEKKFYLTNSYHCSLRLVALQCIIYSILNLHIFFLSLFCRKYLVDFLFTVSEHLLLSHGTRFLAVKLMDHFMDKHIVMDYRMKLVALTSLLVAGMINTWQLCMHNRNVYQLLLSISTTSTPNN